MISHVMVRWLVLALVAAAVSVASANPLPPFANAHMHLAHETVTVKISGQEAVVTGDYKFSIPKGVYSGVLLYLPVYGSPDEDKEFFEARIISDEGPLPMWPSDRNSQSFHDGEKELKMPALEGQKVMWMMFSRQHKIREAHEVDFSIHYRQKLSQGRFIYTPLIPNMIPDHDYGTITIESEDGLKLLDEDKHSFELKDGRIVVKPSHMRGIIVESQGPRRAWDIGCEFKEKFEAAQKPDHGFHAEFANGLSERDVVLFCKYGRDHDLVMECYRRWGSIDHESALNHSMAKEKHLREELLEPKKGGWLEGEDLEDLANMMAYDSFRQVIKGWAHVDPKAAWQAYKNVEGVFGQSKSVAAYSYDLAELFFAELARVDAAYAFEELLQLPPGSNSANPAEPAGAQVADPFEKQPQGVHDAIHLDHLLSHRLKGYCAGAPDGQNWEEYLKRILSHQCFSHALKREVAVSLLGRWLKDAPDEARRWFESGSVRDLHWYALEDQDVDPFSTKPPLPDDQCTQIRNHMGSAAGYWASRDFVAAWKWVNARYPEWPDDLRHEFYRGYRHGQSGDPHESAVDLMMAEDARGLSDAQRLHLAESVFIPEWKARLSDGSLAKGFRNETAVECLRRLGVDEALWPITEK